LRKCSIARVMMSSRLTRVRLPAIFATSRMDVVFWGICLKCAAIDTRA
jgi:hypothetical protein